MPRVVSGFCWTEIIKMHSHYWHGCLRLLMLMYHWCTWLNLAHTSYKNTYRYLRRWELLTMCCLVASRSQPIALFFGIEYVVLLFQRAQDNYRCSRLNLYVYVLSCAVYHLWYGEWWSKYKYWEAQQIDYITGRYNPSYLPQRIFYVHYRDFIPFLSTWNFW